MIVGNGMIARAMRNIDNNNLLIFASGVSNSLETDKKAYEREYNLLKEVVSKFPDKKLIYFSTCSIYDAYRQQDMYVSFKLKIESFIKNNVSKYIIFRVGNIVATGGNPGNLINFLTTSIVSNMKFTLFIGARRLLIDIKDVVKLVELYQSIFKNKIVDLYYPYQYSVFEIVRTIEKIYGIKGQYVLVKKETKFELPITSDLEMYFADFYSSQVYLERMLLRHLKHRIAYGPQDVLLGNKKYAIQN